ncbi:P-loop containing nucleoside triphosphate hydrolase protein [Mycena polygramma]|nr:P-loop containing nucleoside triphosphate hydrolase protein [Mycena polygramma]
MAFCPQDRSFGPASSCRDLDFTLYFEQTILSLCPDIIFVVLAVTRLVYLASQGTRIKHSAWSYTLAALKGTVSLFVVASTIASLVQSRKLPILSASLGLASPILQTVCAGFLTSLVLFEHFKSIRPSTLILVYAFIKGVFGAAIMRTSIRIGGPHTSTVLLEVVTAAHFCTALAELLGKPRALIDEAVPRVSSSSVASRPLYMWLLPLMWAGRKKTLTIPECGAIPTELGAHASTEPLRRVLITMAPRSRYLMWASLRAFPLLFLSPIVPRILLLLATFAQPLLVSRMINFISISDQSSERGWALVGGFVCIYALIFLLTSVYWEKVFDCTVRYRGALVGNIFSKTLHLSSASGREVGGGVASTYMSVDVERVCVGLETIHEMWAAVVSIVLAVVLLYSQVTWPAFLPLALTLLLVTVSTYISKGVGAAHMQWLGATDKRVKFLTSLVHNFLPVKLSRYEDVLAKRAAYLRAQEMTGARSFYNNISVTGSLTATSSVAITLSVLGPYAALAVRGQGPLDPTRLFTIVTTINLMASPLTLLGTGLPQIRAALASVQRIEKYLLLEERTVQSSAQVKDTRSWEKIDSPSEKIDIPPSSDIILEAASFSWAADKPAFLGPLSVGLNPRYLHLCVGPVASGKTFFLLSILGETVLTAGNLVASGTPVAYAAQDPLIFSGTIRENILFGQEFSEQWYNTVLEACALRLDIERMSAKDGTLLGEKGATLSGGQRQRISIARAVYAKAPWTLLDDSFSSLDAATEKHIFQSLFGPTGLLRNKGVVLVTHNLKHLTSADQVLVFDAGTLKHHGTLDELAASGYQVDREMDTPQDASAPAESPEASTEVEVHAPQKEKAEPPIPKSSMGFTPYLFYMRMAGWTGSLIVVFLLSCTGLVRLGTQVYLQQWSNNGGKHMGAWVGGYAGFTVGYLLVVGFGMWGYTLVISTTLGQNMHATELRGLLWTSPAYIATTTAGRIINRFSQDIFMTDLEFPWNVLNVIMQSVTLAGQVVFILIPTPWLALTVPFLGALYWLLLSFYLRTAKQFQSLSSASKSPLYTLFSSTLSGLVTIRALGVEDHFQQQNDLHLDNSQVPFYFRFASICLLRTFLAMISFIIATGLSALAVGLRHSTNASTLGLALSSLSSMAALLNTLLMNLTGLENAAVALSRIHEIATLPKEYDPGVLHSDKKSDRSGSLGGSVEFQDVYLQYSEDMKPAVKGVSFQITAGQKIGVCGRTGSGKSSLIMALFRAVDPSFISGHIFVDGVDTRTLPLDDLRNSIGLVAQAPFLWYAPLRQNLDPHEKLSDDEIWLALERTGMKSAVSDLNLKLETVLEDGGSFSSGQRQLLCLARALLRKTNILVLDEASSRYGQENPGDHSNRPR